MNLVGQSTTNSNGGGALYFTESQSNKDPTNLILIDSCTFLNNSNINGGAISFDNVGNIVIRGSIFNGNTASNAGGAIIFSCQNNGLNSSDQCSLAISKTVFSGNRALQVGGAIKWNMYEPSFANVTMTNNSAAIYGNDNASVAKYLVQITEPELGSIMLNPKR